MKSYKRAPNDSTQWLCPWIDCAHGMGLAGAGMCSARGDWEDPKCSKYITEEKYLEEWKDEETNRSANNKGE